MRDLTPEEIYNSGSWNYVNLQVRYMVDSGIHPNMHFFASKPLGKRALELAIANMKACTVVRLSEELEGTVHLANKQFGWRLSTHKRINVAKSEKSITDELRKRIEKDNALDIAFYAAAKSHFYEQLRQK